MWGKFISDTYAKVRHKADEVRCQVSHQAQKAKEALGLAKANSQTAEACRRQLENQALSICSVHTLCEVYRSWIGQISQSAAEGCTRFVEESVSELQQSSPQVVDSNGSAFFPLGKSPPKGVFAGAKLEQSPEVSSCATPSSSSPSSSFSAPSYSLLEQKVVSTTHPLEHLHKSKSLIAADDIECLSHLSSLNFGGYTFKQVFLSSNALQLSLFCIAKSPNISHIELIGHHEETENVEYSAKSYILQLLHLCLSGDEKLHREILYVLMTSNNRYNSEIEEVGINNNIYNIDNQNSKSKMRNLNNLISIEKQRREEIVALFKNISAKESDIHEKKEDLPSKDQIVNNYDSSLNDIMRNNTLFIFINKLIDILKYDWIDDRLLDIRTQLSVQIETLKDKLNSFSVTPCGQIIEELNESIISDGFIKHNIRIRTSKKLISLYKELEENLHKCIERRKRIVACKEQQIKELNENLRKFEKNFDEEKYLSSDAKAILQDEKNKESELLLTEINESNEELLLIDDEIQSFEVVLNDLKAKVDEVTLKIKELKEKKRKKLSDFDLLKDTLDKIQMKYNVKLQSVGSNICEKEQQKIDLSNIQTVATKAELCLNEKMFCNYTNEIIVKANKVKEPLVNTVYKHIAFEKSRLQHQSEVLERYIFIIQNYSKEKKVCKKKLCDLVNLHSTLQVDVKEEEEKTLLENENQIALSNITKSIEKQNKFLEELHVSELDFKHKFAKALNQLDLIWSDILNFRRDNESILLHVSFNEDASQQETALQQINDSLKTSDISMNSSTNAMEELQAFYMRIKQNVAQHIDIITGEVYNSSSENELHSLSNCNDGISSADSPISTSVYCNTRKEKIEQGRVNTCFSGLSGASSATSGKLEESTVVPSLLFFKEKEQEGGGGGAEGGGGAAEGGKGGAEGGKGGGEGGKGGAEGGKGGGEGGKGGGEGGKGGGGEKGGGAEEERMKKSANYVSSSFPPLCRSSSSAPSYSSSLHSSSFPTFQNSMNVLNDQTAKYPAVEFSISDSPPDSPKKEEDPHDFFMDYNKFNTKRAGKDEGKHKDD